LTPWWEKVDGQDMKQVSKKSNKKGGKNKKIQEEDDEDLKVENEEGINAKYKNPFAHNEGDVDLEAHLNPLIQKSGDKIPEIPTEVLRRLHNLGYLTVFGSKVWSALHAENWRIREAAVHAVIKFLEMPLPAKYLEGKSKRLFLAAMEMAKIACEDKILSIYFTGLKILSTALAPPVCGIHKNRRKKNILLQIYLKTIIIINSKKQFIFIILFFNTIFKKKIFFLSVIQ
jgi:centrosomal protein CEP104